MKSVLIAVTLVAISALLFISVSNNSLLASSNSQQLPARIESVLICNPGESGEGEEVPLNVCAWTCPTKTGTCTSGRWACDQDLGRPPTHACEYECSSGGTWGTGSECSYNMCYGARCA